MCQKCLDAVIKHFPSLTDEERGEVLLSATSFPFGSPELIETQLVELVEKTDGTLGGALSFADAELSRQMKEFREKQADNT